MTDNGTYRNDNYSGWQSIVSYLLDLADLYGFHVQQIKEKFGGLRFYYSYDKDDTNKDNQRKMAAAVRGAEATSFRTCEECGKSGMIHRDLDWWRTLCDEHYEPYVKNDSIRLKVIPQDTLYETEVTCDECTNQIRFQGTSTKDLLRHAAQNGWSLNFTRSRARCPKHVRTPSKGLDVPEEPRGK